MHHQKNSYTYRSQYYEVPHESHKSNLNIIWDNYVETLTLSKLECTMRKFMATQTMQNREFMNQLFNTKETLRQLNIVVESLATPNKEMETQISLLAQTPLGPFPEKHVDVVTTTSEKSIENPKKSDNEEGLGEKRVEIEKDPSAPPKREVVEEVEKEALYVVPPPYKSLIPFPRRSVGVKVDSKSKRYEKLLENIHTNAPLFEILNKKRKLEDRETRELISIKKSKLDFQVADEKVEPKPEKDSSQDRARTTTTSLEG